MEKETFKQKEQEKTLVIDIRLTRGLTAGLIAALLIAACVGYLALSHQKALAKPAAAPAAGATGLRQYYMTINIYDGANADTACAAGYHMASLWEILDTSNLEYNVILGDQRGDSGQGPVLGYTGWVRTGYDTDSSTVAGRANCNLWNINTSGSFGTSINLPTDWTLATNIGPWEVYAADCSAAMSVWCVED